MCIWKPYRESEGTGGSGVWIMVFPYHLSVSGNHFILTATSEILSGP